MIRCYLLEHPSYIHPFCGLSQRRSLSIFLFEDEAPIVWPEEFPTSRLNWWVIKRDWDILWKTQSISYCGVRGSQRTKVDLLYRVLLGSLGEALEYRVWLPLWGWIYGIHIIESFGDVDKCHIQLLELFSFFQMIDLIKKIFCATPSPGQNAFCLDDKGQYPNYLPPRMRWNKRHHRINSDRSIFTRSGGLFTFWYTCDDSQFGWRRRDSRYQPEKYVCGQFIATEVSKVIFSRHQVQGSCLSNPWMQSLHPIW